MIKIVSVIGLIIVFVICFLSVSNYRSCDVISGELSSVEIEEKTKVISLVTMNNETEISFLLKNTGDTPVIITSIDISCGCLKIMENINPILPSKTFVLKVFFNPKNIGMFSKSIKVYGNFKESPICLKIYGKVE